MGKQQTNDPLGILSKKEGKAIVEEQVKDPLNILKKKDKKEVGGEDLPTPAKKPTEPSKKSGEDEALPVDRFGIETKLPTDKPEITFPEQDLEKAELLSHDIQNLETSDTFQTSVKFMEDLNDEAGRVKELGDAIGKQPSWEQTTDWVAWDARRNNYNQALGKYLDKEEEAEPHINTLRNFDNYISEFKHLKSRIGDIDKKRVYDPILLGQVEAFIKNESPDMLEDEVKALAKQEIDNSGIMDRPDKGLERNIAKSFGMAAYGAVADLLPAGAESKTAMTHRKMFVKHNDELKSLEGLKDTDDIVLTGLVGRGPKTYKVGRARELLEERKNNNVKLMVQHFANAAEELDELAGRKLIQHIDQVNWGDPQSVANFAASSVGQGVGQLPLTFLTLGTAGDLMETGTTYIEGVKKIMEKTGLSYEEIVAQDLDDPAAAEAWGKFAAALEYTGALSVFGKGPFKNIFKAMSRKTFGMGFLKAAVPEGVTEFIQSVATQYGAGRVAKQSPEEAWGNIKWRDAFSEGLSGLLAGGTISGTRSFILGKLEKTDPDVKSAIADEQKNIDTSNIDSVDAATKRIQDKIEADEAGVTTPAAATIVVEPGMAEPGMEVSVEFPEAQEGMVQEETGIAKVTPKEVAEEDVKPTEITAEQKKKGVLYVSENGKAVVTRDKHGDVIVLKHDGTEFAQDQSQVYIDEAFENTDFEAFEATVIPEGTTEGDYTNLLVEESNNPAEVAEQYDRVNERGFDTEGDVNSLIEGEIGNISVVGWNNEGDRKLTTPALKKKFLRKKGDAPSDIASRINSQFEGKEERVTTEDVVQYMLDSVKPKEERIKGDALELQKLSDKFKQLTGKELTPELAKVISTRDISKEVADKISEVDQYMSDTAVMDVETLEQYQSEINEQIKKDEGIKTTKEDVAKAKQRDIKPEEGEVTDKLKAKESKIKDDLKGLFDEFGKTSAAMTGIDPKQVEIAGRIIAKLAELGITKLEQIVKYIKENYPGWIDNNMDALNEAFSKVKPKKPPTKEVADGKPKKRKLSYTMRVLDHYSDSKTIEEAVKEKGTETEVSEWKKLRPIADEIFSEAISDTKNAVKNIKALTDKIFSYTYKDLAKNIHQSTINAMVMHKILDYLANHGEIDLFVEYSDLFASSAASAGKFNAALQERATPEAVANSAKEQFIKDQKVAMEQKADTDMLVSEEISKIQQELQLKDNEVERLKLVVSGMYEKLKKQKKTDTPGIKRANERKQQKKEIKSNINKKVDRLNQLFKQQMGQLNAGVPMTAEMIGLIGEIIVEYSKLAFFEVLDVKDAVLARFSGNKDIQKHINANWDNIMSEELTEEAMDEQTADFVKALEKRAKRNLLKRGDKKVSPEKLLLDTLLRKVDETIKPQKGKPKRSALDRIREGFKNNIFTDQVWTEAMGNISTWLDSVKDMTPELKAEIMADLEDSMSQFMETPFAKSDLRNAIKDGAKDLGIAIQEVVKKHYSEQNIAMQTLAERLISDLGISGEMAQEVQNRIEKEVKQIFEETRIKQIQKMLNLDSAGMPKKAANKANKQVIDRILEAINLGMLGDTHFQELFSEKYGFKSLSKKEIAKILHFNDLINLHKGDPLARQYSQELMDYVATLKPSSAEKFYNNAIALVIKGLLTAISSTMMVTIPLGSFLAYKLHTIPRALSNPMATIQAMAAFRKSGLKGMGFRDFVDVMRTGFSMLDEGDAKWEEANQNVKGLNIDYWIHHSVWEDFMAKAKEAKTDTERMKWAGISITRAWAKLAIVANYAKAFDVILNHRGEEMAFFIEEYNDQLKARGQKVTHNFSQASDIAAAVKKLMGYDEETVARLKEEVEQDIADMRSRGETVGKGTAQVLLKDKMQSLRDADKSKRARQWVKEATLMTPKPEGVSGAFYSEFNRITTIDETSGYIGGGFKFMFKMVFGLFLRISITFGQKAWEHIPGLGLVQGVFWDYKPTPVDPKKPKGLQRWEIKMNDKKTRDRKLFSHALYAGLAPIALAAAMFEWDDDEDRLKLKEDRWIDITGYGTSKYYLKEQLAELNPDGTIRERKDHTIFLKINGRWQPILPSWLMPQLLATNAILGGMRDESLMEPSVFKDRNVYDFYTKYYDDIIFSVTELSWATIPKNIKSLTFAAMTGGPTGMAERFGQIALNPTRSIVYNNMLRDINNEIGAITGESVKTGSPLENLVKDVPLFDEMLLSDKFDTFGYPVKRQSKLIYALENTPPLSFTLGSLYDFKNFNKERFDSPVWQAKMEYQPHAIISGFSLNGFNYTEDGKTKWHKYNSKEKAVGYVAYGVAMRNYWLEDLAKKESHIKTLDVEIFTEALVGGNGAWHRASSQAAKIAIQAYIEEEEAKNR